MKMRIKEKMIVTTFSKWDKPVTRRFTKQTLSDRKEVYSTVLLEKCKMLMKKYGEKMKPGCSPYDHALIIMINKGAKTSGYDSSKEFCVANYEYMNYLLTEDK